LSLATSTLNELLSFEQVKVEREMIFKIMRPNLFSKGLRFTWDMQTYKYNSGTPK
jgi:hypothetical protein